MFAVVVLPYGQRVENSGFLSDRPSAGAHQVALCSNTAAQFLVLGALLPGSCQFTKFKQIWLGKEKQTKKKSKNICPMGTAAMSTHPAVSCRQGSW